MKSRLLGAVCVLLCCFSVPAHAIPTLFFDGDIQYDVSTGELSVTSLLTATKDIVPAPNLIGSSLLFDALFSSVFDNGMFTTGTFVGMSGDDLTVVDGNSTTLLTGDFLSLEMKGFNGLDSGLVKGVVSATGGSLAALFGEGNLFALELDLSTVFGGTMFDSSFSGAIDGRIEGAEVVAPIALWLLGTGILLVGASQTCRKTIS